jgi:hypothetical protein
MALKLEANTIESPFPVVSVDWFHSGTGNMSEEGYCKLTTTDHPSAPFLDKSNAGCLLAPQQL